MKTTAAFILAAANLVAGHATFQSFVIDGKNQGHHFAVQTPSNGNNPIKDVTSPSMICNGGSATADQVEVAAGSTIGMQWHHNDDGKDTFPIGDSDEPIAASHKGPVMVYMAPAESKGEGAVWTKIYEEGLSGGKWAVETFITNKGLITVDLPNLKAGDYLIRPEIIGLHEANSQGGAQFYNGCGQIKVTGSGSVALPATGVGMTKAYSPTDAGVLFNLYNGATTYEIPGPKVWDGASSGSAPAPSTPSETAATPVASAAPSKTLTPVASASPVATPVEEAEPATPTAVESATPAPSSGSGSGSALPETFTIEQFISWLKSTTGTSARRTRRAHARAFQFLPRDRSIDYSRAFLTAPRRRDAEDRSGHLTSTLVSPPIPNTSEYSSSNPTSPIISGDTEGPKWRLEHSSNNRAVCNQAACKRAQVKIVKGELRIGTKTLFDNDMGQRWYIAWRHWGCATKHQISGLKELTDNDPTKAFGFDGLSLESQEQVRLAFEEGKPVDKEFKDIREDLAAVVPCYAREYTDAQGYKADVSNRTAACRGAACSQKSAKVLKGELRLGILVDYDGEHASWYYKHWQCMSAYDLGQAKQRFDDGDEINHTFDGIDALPVEYKQIVIDTLTTGRVTEPPQPEPAAPPKPKKPRARKQKGLEVTETSAKQEDGIDDEARVGTPKLKRTRKKGVNEEMDENEAEYVPRKTRSRQVVTVEEVDPNVARIQASTEQMREKAAQ